MTSHSKARFALGLSVLMLVLAAGCAGLRVPDSMTKGDITPKRKQRQSEMSRHFQEQRDAAEFESAQAQWLQQRDPKGCRETLERLLARNPKHRNAHLLLAELCLSQNDPVAANRHAKSALDLYPNDAEVQYTMGLTLDAQGKTSDALSYYERAARARRTIQTMPPPMSLPAKLPNRRFGNQELPRLTTPT